VKYLVDPIILALHYTHHPLLTHQEAACMLLNYTAHLDF
jgi:hypothetical protein